MSQQLFIGFTVEGTTDTRFMKQVIQNVFEEAAFECRTDVEIEDVRIIDVPKIEFVEMICNASNKAATEYGVSVLCVHVDSDARTIRDVISYKLSPLQEAMVNLDNQNHCKNIVPIIPIQMTESWMLADKELLKKKINAVDKQDEELGIHRHPESYADPKQAIEEALRIAQANKTRRRRNDLTISELYEELGQAITLDRLRTLHSFNDFEDNVKAAFQKLGYVN